MRKDRIINFRVPEAVYAELMALKVQSGVETLTELIKESLLARSWKLELERNREYHKEILQALDDVEKRMVKTEKVREKVGKSMDAVKAARATKTRLKQTDS